MAGSLAVEAAEKRVFHTLDALRGVAAIAVLFGHYDIYLAPFRLGSAYLAVDLFFVMSGFVLARAYGARFEGGLSARTFMTMRWVRLYPLYAIGSAVTVLVAVVGLISGASTAWTWTRLVAALVPALLLLPAPTLAGETSGLYPLDRPAWSLFYELVANLIFVLCWRRAGGRAVWTFVAAGGIGLVASTLLVGGLNAGSVWSEAATGLLRVLFSFFLGVAMERWYETKRVPRLRCPPVVLLAVAVLVLALDPGSALRPVYDLTCVVVVFPALVWLCLSNEPRGGTRAFAALGLISYPLYVIHIPVAYVLTRGIQHALGRDPVTLAPAIGAGMAVLLLGISWLLARFVDGPARKRLAALVRLNAPRVP